MFLFEESFEWISVESRNYFPPGLFTTVDLTGDRRLPYGFFFLQNDSSCLFPTGRGSLRMSPSPTGCGTTSPTGSHTGDRTSTAPGVPLACAPPKLFPNHFFTGNVPHLRLERRCSHLEIAHSLPVKDVWYVIQCNTHSMGHHWVYSCLLLIESVSYKGSNGCILLKQWQQSELPGSKFSEQWVTVGFESFAICHFKSGPCSHRLDCHYHCSYYFADFVWHPSIPTVGSSLSCWFVEAALLTLFVIIIIVPVTLFTLFVMIIIVCLW